MAQHLYVIQSYVTGAVKIGRSSTPDKRLKSLQTGSPYELRLVAVYEGKGHLELEIHKKLIRFQVSFMRGEWFSPECLPNLPNWMYAKLPLEDWWKGESFKDLP
jgi:hypothetical protein